jgi:polysaccharide biosynthesis transport protein
MPQYDVTLRDYWRILRKRKTIVIFATVMLGITSYITALMSTPTLRYEASAKIQFEQNQSAQEAYISAIGGADALETEQTVISSYPVVTRVAHRLGVIDTTDATHEEKIRAILSVRGQIRTEIEGLTNIITITVSGTKPDKTQEMANVVAEEYREYNFETKNAKVLGALNFIRAQRDTVQKRLRVAQNKLKDFQERTQIISIGEQTRSILSQISDVREQHESTGQLHKNITRLMDEFDDTGITDETSLATIPPEEGGARFVQLSNQLQLLNQERSRLLVRFTLQHPSIVDLEVNKQVVIDEMVSSLRRQQSIVSTRKQNLGRSLKDLEARYHEIPELAIELGDLERDVNTQTELLLVLEEEYQQSQILESSEVPEVSILQQALRPNSPTNPSTPRTSAIIGAVLGMILGVVFAFVAETLDTSIGTIQDVEEFLGVSVVGIIPQVDVEDMKEAMERSGLDPNDSELVERRMRLAAHFEPQSTIAESYRGLRTNIQFATLDKGAKLVSVTSASHQEGKSTTTANLAMTLAQAGNRVLLVDGDLRRPTIARIFGLDREPGLTDVILGNYSWREVVRTVTDIMVGGLGMEDIMMTPGMDNLNIITSGLIPPNPAEITDSRRMSEFLVEVKEAYDVVLVDSPPTLQATDATIIGTKVDGVILVYKIGQVSRSALHRAKLQLDAVNVPVLGIVINGLRAEVSEDFRDLRYYSYYSYGSKDEEQSTNPIIRTYERGVRKAKQTWSAVQEKSAPYVARAAERLGIELTDETDVMEDDQQSFSTRLPRILLWTLLGLFVLTGLMWQIGLIGGQPGRGPVQKSRNVASLVGVIDAEHTELTPKIGDLDTLVAAVPDAAPAPSPTPPPVSPTQVEPRVSTGVYYVHTSSHISRHSATRELERLRLRDLPGKIVTVDIPQKGIYHRVLVGPYDSKGLARVSADRIKDNNWAGYTAIRKQR